MLVKNILIYPTSPPPLAKKKLALRSPLSLNSRDIVRAMVDFPVPAIPFNQKMQLLISAGFVAVEGLGDIVGVTVPVAQVSESYRGTSIGFPTLEYCG
jgi:hypothetical protein